MLGWARFRHLRSHLWDWILLDCYWEKGKGVHKRGNKVLCPQEVLYWVLEANYRLEDSIWDMWKRDVCSDSQVVNSIFNHFIFNVFPLLIWPSIDGLLCFFPVVLPQGNITGVRKLKKEESILLLCWQWICDFPWLKHENSENNFPPILFRFQVVFLVI